MGIGRPITDGPDNIGVCGAAAVRVVASWADGVVAGVDGAGVEMALYD